MDKLPIFYSFRRCPYAIRARMFLVYAKISVELREVMLKDKPDALGQASPKATVPVLVVSEEAVIDESIAIINWALERSDPEGFLEQSTLDQSYALIDTNDFVFKPLLDQYKYADRYPELSIEQHRSNCVFFLGQLELQLTKSPFLCSDKPGIADISLFPFIRQFAFVDKTWFDQADYPNVRNWLNNWLDSHLFAAVMKKYQPWKPGDMPIVFPEY